MFESCVSLVGSSLLMVSHVSAKVRRLVVSASNKHVVSRSCQPRVASVHPRLPSILKSVARRCFEDTSIDAKSRYEAVVSREKREERAGCSIHCGHGLRSAGGLDSLADKTHACGLFRTLRHRTPTRKRYCLPNLLTLVGDMRVVLSTIHLVFRADQHYTCLLNATIRYHENSSTFLIMATLETEVCSDTQAACSNW